MRTLILGHKHHGKDHVAKIIKRLYGQQWFSSSLFALEMAVWPALRRAGVFYPDQDAAYVDRDNHRQLWKDAISVYNTPDKARLARELLAECDMYVGLRCPEEFTAAKAEGLFDLVIWVHRPGYPPEPTMGIEYDPASMEVIVNIGDVEPQVRKIWEKYAVRS